MWVQFFNVPQVTNENTQKQDMLANLNDMQKEVVLQNRGPVLVLAGAGSGKTSALTTRIAWMIKTEGIAPWNILAVTFTNKAANEMKERVLKLMGQYTDEGNSPNIGTFHSICVRILRKHIHNLGYDRSFVIYDTADQQILMKRVLEDLLIDSKQFNPKAILNFISGAKNELLGPEEYAKFSSGNHFTEKVAKAYRRYQHQLQKNNALDFDDIIMKTVELFKTFPEILDHYQEQFRFISVDEYQDTNHAQYVLTNLLAEKYHNLCVIGDSDQSIYSFRGANIQNILNFEKDYPEAKVIFLEQNYRSTQVILDAAHSVIVKNTQRKDKQLWTERKEGEKITLKTVGNEREEGEFIAQRILDKLRAMDEKDYRHFVVLYRTNAQSRVLEEAFLRNGIPYKIVGGIKFYERKEIKDMVSYLHSLVNPNDSISLLRIINTPPRKIGEKTIETIQQYAVEHDLSFWQALTQIDQIEAIRGAKSKALEDFVQLIRDLQKINQEFPASGVIKHVLDSSGYKRFVDDGTAEGEARLQNVYELISVAGKYDKLPAGESLSIFLEEISLIADVDKLDEKDNAVTLMTIHSAKGLEFPTVFLVGLEDGIFPHSRSLLERKELEEERRLMYVAITRAKDKLYLLHSRNRLLYGESSSNPPSQFLKDIPETVLEREEEISKPRYFTQFSKSRLIPHETAETVFTAEEPVYAQEEVKFSDEYSDELHEGDRVHHDTFGDGEIISLKGGVATIRFDSIRYGTKKLALSIAPLKKLN
jgi:DNA helicase-2/ATP-dependent DNA helicase PcrA